MPNDPPTPAPPDPTPNRSPDTIDPIDDSEPVSVGEIADAVLERLKPLVTGGGTPAPTPTPDPPSDPAPSPTPTNPDPAPSPPPTGQSIEEQIEAGVARVLGAKEHEAAHAAIRPPEPKPARKGLAALVFGPERK